MIVVKIIAAILGICFVFAGFYLSYALKAKKEILGSLLSIVGFILFCLSMLLIFVPKFFA